MNTALRPMYKCRAKAPKLPTFIYQALLGRVLMIRARLLRSGVKRNFHAPFWSSGGGSDAPADCNNPRFLTHLFLKRKECSVAEVRHFSSP